MLFFLTGCTAPLPGTVLWVREGPSGPRTWFAEAASPQKAQPIGAFDLPTFPGPADPAGTHALLLTVEDTAQGHRESLWSQPIAGGRATLLGPRSARLRNPVWSHDGSKVYVETDHESFRDIVRVDRDGSHYKRLTKTEKGTYEPTLAPDGSLAFISSRDGNAELYVQLGTDVRRLTEHAGNDTHPRFSSEGRLAWLAWRGDRVSVHLVTDGTTAPLVNEDPGNARAFSWSPKADRMAIVRQTGPKDMAIDIVLLDGTTLATLDGPGPDEHPTWSPDGRHLLFSSARSGNADLFVASADGSGVRPFVSSPDPEWLPRWMGE